MGEDESQAPLTSGGVGICLSGGGLRAASFGLGALQALQDRCGLLRGPNAARYLSAVSGGSYIAGAYTLANCGQKFPLDGGGMGAEASPAQPPFAPDSPEAEHLRRHCRYMVEEGGVLFSIVLALLIAFNLFAIVLFIAFVGYYLGLIAWIISYVQPVPAVWLQWALAAVFIGAVVYGVRQVDVPSERRPFPAVVLLIPISLAALAGIYPFVLRLESIPPLESPAWLLDNLPLVLGGIGVVAGLTALAALLGLWLRHFALLPMVRRIGTAILARWLVVAAGVLLISWSTVWIFGVFDDPDVAPWQAGVVILIFVLGLFFPSLVVSRASPHFIYRDRLLRCFSVVRYVEATKPATAKRPRDGKEIRMSDLSPPAAGRADSFPELLICAAINVSDVGATPAGSNALSLVISPERMEVPEVPGACLTTKDLERLQRPRTVISGWGPALNLASAVAMTGAAISPAMGKRTRADLRALFAVFDVRLGVWLPNPLNHTVREGIKTRSPKVRVGMLGLLREIFGLHSERADEIYVTDGGHYDNLGLVELLRKGCTEIWCIDASGDKPGRATALSEALLTASGELGVHVEIDLDDFGRTSASHSGQPILANTTIEGTIRYPDGTRGNLRVVKLGITERTPSMLHEYRRTDRRFPHHSTINQIYRAERFDAYRELGWASTQEALDSWQCPAAFSPPPPSASDGKALARVG